MKNSNKIYVILTDTGTVFNRLIKMYTKDPYNHVSIAFDPDLKEVFSFGRKKEHNPIIAGFARENMDHMLFKNANSAVFELECDNPAAYWKVRKYVRKFELNEENYRYNLLGVLALMFKINIERNDAFFCSQFVASIFEYSGIPLFDKPCVFVTPGDFMDASDLQLVYNGRLGDYRKMLAQQSTLHHVVEELDKPEMNPALSEI